MIHPIFPLHLGLEVTQCCRAQLLVMAVASRCWWGEESNPLEISGPNLILPSGTEAGGCQLSASDKPVVTAWCGSRLQKQWQQHPPAAGAAGPASQLVEEQLGHAKDRYCHKSDGSDVANTFNLYQ